MIRFPRKKKEISTELLVRMIWVSTFLAMIFALPPIAIFLGIYYTIGNLVLGAVVGFGVHFVILVFAGRISKFLTKIIS